MMPQTFVSRFRLGSLAIAFLLGACSGAAAPTAPVQAPPAGSPTLAKGEPLRPGREAPSLLTDSASFTVVQGESSTLVVYYDMPQTPEPDQGRWFLQLELPSDAQFVDALGNPRADGDSVEISITIDASQFLVHLEPHGSQFPGDPAVLTFNLQYADFQGRAIQELRIWYQPEVGDAWSAQPTTVDVIGNRIFAELGHFSNYAIAW